MTRIQKNYSVLFIFLVLFVCETFVFSQAEPSAKEIKTTVTFTPVVMLESWTTYSMNEEKNGTEYDDRPDVHFRRLRFGGKGELYDGISYAFAFHYDRLGEDEYAATKGSEGEAVDVWNAYISARLLKGSELFNLHMGYFWAAISRETNTSPWAVSSFDKAYSDWYLRKFMTAQGNAIESGMGLQLKL